MIDNMESDTSVIKSDPSSLSGKYVMSAWGKRLIALEDNVFRRKKLLKGRSYWTCVWERKSGCKVRIHVLENDSEHPTFIKIVGEHNHDTTKGQVETRFAVNRLKRKAIETSAKPSKILRNLISQEPSMEDKFKSSENIKHTLRRVRKSKKSKSLGSGVESQIPPMKNKYHHSKRKSMTLLSPNTEDAQTIVEINTNIDPVNQFDSASIMQDIFAKNIESAHKPLQGKVILVTGASSGIGQAISEIVANAGANVCIGARRRDKLTSIREKIELNGGIALQYDLDVTNRTQFQEVVQTIEENVGPIDIVINNAGVMFYTHMHNAMIDDWDEMIEVNCRGVTNSIGCILPGMVERRRGHIVNISSDAGKRGFPGLGVYSATKFFVEGLSQSLRHEVKDKGIRVTCIQPGDVKTEIGNYTRDHDAQIKYDLTQTTEKILDPADIGNAVLYAITAPEHVGVNEILIEPKECCV